MDIEQVKPKKPNFGLVVGLAAAVMILLILTAYFTLHWDGKKLMPHHQQPHPTSQLPAPTTQVGNLA